MVEADCHEITTKKGDSANVSACIVARNERGSTAKTTSRISDGEVESKAAIALELDLFH